MTEKRTFYSGTGLQSEGQLVADNPTKIQDIVPAPALGKKEHSTQKKEHSTQEKEHSTQEKEHSTQEPKPRNPHKIRLFSPSENPNR